MMRKLIWVAATVFLFSCGDAFTDSTLPPEGEVDSLGPARVLDQSLTKGSGGTNGDGNFCDDPAFPCASGEGDCDATSQCESGLICGSDVGAQFGFTAATDVCVPQHCTNGMLDGDETSIDCGGSCGSNCGPTGSNGDAEYCSQSNYLCQAGEGDCDGDPECDSGLVCGKDNGANFGFTAATDVCVVAHCTNGVQDADETSIDCGGNDCGNCTRTGTNGDGDYCNDPAFPCASGEGDCDQDSQCQSGLICGDDNGARFGFSARTDVCVPAHCESGVIDGDETAVDCGGSCGVCEKTGQNGDPDYCNDPALPCEQGEGDCDRDSQCVSGLVCANNNGELWGFSSTTDVCVPPHCESGVQDGDETDIDCGGSCGRCPLPVGHPDYCEAPTYTCTVGEGDCDTDDDCDGDLICKTASGPNFGFETSVDSCVAFYCDDGIQNGDETGIDCGGSCGDCLLERFGSSDFDAGRDIAIDAENNLYVAGVFSGTIDLGDGPISVVGGRTGYFAKYDSLGNLIWKRVFASGGFDEGSRVELAPNGDLVVAGRFSETVNLGGTDLVSNGGIDYFVARFDSDGNHLWSTGYGGLGDEFVAGLRLDGAGDLVVSGGFLNETNLGGGPVFSAGFQDIFVAKYDGTDGSYVWGNSYGGTNADYIGEIAVDSSDRVYVTGGFFESVDFGGGALTSAGSADLFILQLNSDGSHADSTRIGSTGVEIGRALAIGPGDTVYLTGGFTGTVTFGATEVTSTSGSRDVFLSRLDTSLNFAWTVAEGGPSTDEGRIISVDSSGQVAMTGIFRGSGFVIGSETLNAFGDYDAYVARYSSSGAFIAGVEQLASVGDDYLEGIAYGSDGRTVAIGYYRNNGQWLGVNFPAVGLSDIIMGTTF